VKKDGEDRLGWRDAELKGNCVVRMSVGQCPGRISDESTAPALQHNQEHLMTLD
jgi:hypothetical protein